MSATTIEDRIRQVAEAELAKPAYQEFHLRVGPIEAKGDDWWYIVVHPTENIDRDRMYYNALHDVEDVIEAAFPDVSILVVPVIPPDE
jgi:hypothetical protein